MRKINLALLSGFLLLTNSCSIFEPKKKVEFIVNADYGFHVKDEITYLLNDSKIFIDFDEYGVEPVVGMKVDITYKGEYYILETYPSTFDDSNMKIIDIDIFMPKIYDYIYSQTPGGGEKLSLRPLNESFMGVINQNYVINEDGSFSELTDFTFDDKIYVATQVNNEVETCFGLYSYNPVNDQTVETIMNG